MDLAERAGVLSKRELEITGLNARELVRGMGEKRWSAVEVCRGFCKRAVGAHQVVCYLFPHLVLKIFVTGRGGALEDERGEFIDKIYLDKLSGPHPLRLRSETSS